MIKKASLVTAIRDNISANQKKFLAEVIGTFIVVVLATGSVVIDAKLNGTFGIPSVAFPINNAFMKLSVLLVESA